MGRSARVILDNRELVNDWIAERGGGRCHPGSYSTLGLVDVHGRLIGGLAFYDANAHNCFVNVALTPGCPWKPLLFAGLRYTFAQLALRRLTFVVREGNIPSINLIRDLGSQHEATLRGAGNEGEDLHIFMLSPETCPIWRKLRGQRIGQRTSSAGSSGHHSPANGG